jgi:hypothetical protein
MSQVVTANRLYDGAVVFVGADHSWIERLDRAAMFEGKDAVAAALERAKRDEENNVVVDVYAVDVSANSGAVVPTKLRELIRARGPTIHPEFTKPGSVPPRAQEDDHVSV